MSEHDSGVRLAKRVAELKACSRAEAERYIEGGWVSVNGEVVELPQHRVSEHDVVTLATNARATTVASTALRGHHPNGHTSAATAIDTAPPPRPSLPTRRHR